MYDHVYSTKKTAMTLYTVQFDRKFNTELAKKGSKLNCRMAEIWIASGWKAVTIYRAGAKNYVDIAVIRDLFVS